MKNKVIALFTCLCLCFSMSACGQNKTEEPVTESERAVSVNNGTLTAESTALSVGKTAVTYDEYKVYYYFMKSQYEPVLGQDVWKYPVGADGRTIGQDAIEDVLRLIIQVKVINKAAALQNVTLAADEKEEADNSASKYCETLSEDVKKENGINAVLVSRIFEENKLAEKMYNIITGKTEVNLSDDQCQAARVHLIYLKADDANREQARQKATELQSVAKSASSFYTLAKENTQAGQVEYLIGRQDSRTKLAQTVLGMKEGSISNVIEESDGFYIAYCVEENNKSIRNEYKNQIVEERQNKAFADEYKKWADAYEVKVSKSLLVK